MIFAEANLTTMALPDGKKLAVVSWQGAMNAYNLLHKDHVQLMDIVKHTLERANAKEQVLKDMFAE
jgi:hypothetical protein